MKATVIVLLIAVFIISVVFAIRNAWKDHVRKLEDDNTQKQIDEWEQLRADGYYR